MKAGPEILSFGAAPAEIEAGAASTLSWKTARASSIEILDQRGAAIDTGSAAVAAGSVEVRPEVDSTYRLVATGADGVKVESQTTVTVRPADAPRIIEFSANPSSIASGGTATLTWGTERADSIRIVAGGEEVPLGGAAAEAGSVEVKPTITTRYRLEATRGAESVTAEVTVELLAPPAVEFTIDSDTIDFGGSTTASWSAPGATRVVVTEGDTILTVSDRATGSIELSPVRRTVYTLEAEGPGGVSTANAEVAVRPVVSSFTVDPSRPTPVGADVTLTWSAAGADRIDITNGEGFDFTVPATSLNDGFVVARVASEGSFVLTASLEGNEVVRTVQVEILPLPEILDFDAAPRTLTATAGAPGVTTLSWNVSGARVFLIEAAPGGTILAESNRLPSGSIDVPIEVDTTFTLFATNDAGEVTAEVGVVAVAAPRISSFRALPSRVGPGESFELSWSTEGAVAVSLFEGTSKLPVDPSSVNGAHTAQIAADTDFVLNAVNAAGDLVESTISVGVGAPIVNSFDADRPQADPGETVLLTWENLGGVSLVVSGPDGAIPGCATTDLAEIASGGCPLVVPAGGSSLELSMAVENGVGDVTVATLEIEVNGGAKILSFTRPAAQVSSGDPIALTWSVSTDSLGRPATLTLEDDLGGTWDLADRDPMRDTFSVTATTPGLRTFTLTAASLDGTVATATVDVQVHALSTVTLAALTAPYDPDLGAPLQLSWTVADATSLAVYVLDEEGDPILPAVFEAGPAELSAGAGVVDLEPRAPTTWQAVATNTLGRPAYAAATVEFVPLQLLSFDSDSLEIVAGEPAMLSWTSVGASRVELRPFSEGFQRGSTSAPFIDLSLSPTALEVDFTGETCNTQRADEGCPLVDFPDGFVFPFDGADRDQARVYVNGFLSFDLSRTGDNYDLNPLPSIVRPYVHLAPFWSDLDYGSNGTLFYETGQDAKGWYLVFQWSHWEFNDGADDLNFQVVLYEDGDFDFRYATMDSEWPDDGLGGGASIGHQNLMGTEGDSVGYFDPIPSLPNSGYAFRMFSDGGNGTFAAFPQVSTTYDLTARGYDGTSETSSVTVVVHPAPAISASASARDIDEGETLVIEWATQNASDLTILDGGVSVHVADPGDVASGSASIVATGLGPHTFTVQATGALGRQVTKDFAVNVLAPFGLDSFEAEDPAIAVNGTTILSWTTHGAEMFELTEDGLAIDTTGFDFDSGSLTVSPTNTTEYVLTISRTDGRTFTRSQTVRVIRASLDSVVVSTTRIPAGGTVDVTWNASSPAGDPVGVQVIPSPIEEVVAGVAPFEDISLTGDEQTGFANQDAHAQTIQFPAGFSFPFLGEEQQMVRVATDGFVSFRMDQGSVYQNQRLPSSDNSGVHLAAFWDDLHSYSSGRVYTELVSDGQGDRFIIQWTNFDFWSALGATGADLNFQIVLFRNGSFDYRYATMSGPNQDDADGAGATIGYQQPRAKFGHTISSDEAMAGGLSGRSWRLDASRPLDGTVTVSPGRDGRIEICAFAEFDTDCQTIWVEVIAPGDLLISEIQIDPTGGPGDQWFEVRNISKHAITLDDMEIVSGIEVHTIAPSSPIVLQPGEYATLAAGGNPGFLPDYVYGTDIVFDPTGGDLSIQFGGLTLASMEWDPSWTVTPGVSLSLDGAALSPANVLDSFSDSSIWCESVESYAVSDFGTPGTVGSGCLVDEYDADYFGPPNFIDISATGTPLPLANGGFEEVRVQGGIPFYFPFYDAGPVSDLWVSGYGYMGFGGFCGIFGCYMDWDAGMIMAFSDWDYGLAPQSGSMAYHETKTIGGRQVKIVQWSGMGLWGLTGSITFQVQLWEGGDIVIAFDEIIGDDPAFYGDSAVVGLYSLWWGEEFLFSEYEPHIYEGLTLRYHYR